MIRLLWVSAMLVLIAGISAAGDQFIAGVDIGKDYEARVRSGIEQNRKSPATIDVVSKTGAKIVGAKITVKQTSSDFLFGCAFPMWTAPPQRLGDKGWRNWNRYFTRLFNYATTENSFKWGHMEPQQGAYKWESADFIAKWCKERNIKLKGHNLVWGRDGGGTPAWVWPHTPTEIGNLVKDRISLVMGRYKNDIKIWDVVNEPYHVRDLETAWSKDYVLQSYKWARKADPSAMLVINEYETLRNAATADGFVAMVKDLLAKKAPIDVIAEQAHSSPLWYPPKSIFDTLDKMASTGLRIHITELAYPTSNAKINGGFMTGKWDEQKQAEFYRYFMTLAFSHPNVDAITFWAMWDGSAYKPGGGMIREDWTPKPAYNVVDDLINNKWKTHFEASSDSNGQIRFRGFHGNYEITATSPGGKSTHATMHLFRGSEGHLKIVLD